MTLTAIKQKTCILLKPDALEKNVVGKILDRLESEGFKLVAIKLIPPSKQLLEQFYAEHSGKEFYERFMEFMLSGPLIATAWEGENIVQRSRDVIGATNSKEAKPGTLRNLYGTDNRKNLVHGSDSPSSALRELKIMFRELD